MEFIKTFFKDLVSAPALKRAARTALFSFIALFGASILGWTQDVVGWANDMSGATPFPDSAILVKALISAAGSAAAGFVGLVVNAAENANGGRALFGAKTNTLD